MDIVIFIGVDSGDIAEVCCIYAVLFGNIDCAVAIVFFYPNNVSPGAEYAIAHSVSDTFA